MKLHEYIEQLTALMEHHGAQDFDVKTRYPMLDRWGQYDGEYVEDVTGDQFCLDLDAKIAFVDCDSTDLTPMKELIDDWKTGRIKTT